MKRSIMLFIAFLLTSQCSDLLNFTDCTYDASTSHLEYICDGSSVGDRYAQRTMRYLYCNNYTLGITRSNVRILSFNNCKSPQLDQYFGLYPLRRLRNFNISAMEIETLDGEVFETNQLLEVLIASHNSIGSIPADFFTHLPELVEIDFSYNNISQLGPELFDNVAKLRSINFAHNEIWEYLEDLELVDFNYNRIISIEANLLDSNKELKILNLNNNQLWRLNCEFLLTLHSHSLTILVNTLYYLTTGCRNEHVHMESNVTISPNETTQSALKITNGQFEWTFSETDFKNVKSLNFSNSPMNHIAALLEITSTELSTLDLSNTSMSCELAEKTFRKLKCLQRLYLNRMNLTNFEFKIFSHQKRLVKLDLSSNNLSSIDFRLFFRNFQQLVSLNLEENNLTEIDTITYTHFPKLIELAISKNRFSCDYLRKFSFQWPQLELIKNPSNQTGGAHMNGVDCIREIMNNDNAIGTHDKEKIKVVFENHLNKLYELYENSSSDFNFDHFNCMLVCMRRF